MKKLYKFFKRRTYKVIHRKIIQVKNFCLEINVNSIYADTLYSSYWELYGSLFCDRAKEVTSQQRRTFYNNFFAFVRVMVCGNYVA